MIARTIDEPQATNDVVVAIITRIGVMNPMQYLVRMNLGDSKTRRGNPSNRSNR